MFKRIIPWNQTDEELKIIHWYDDCSTGRWWKPLLTGKWRQALTVNVQLCSDAPGDIVARRARTQWYSVQAWLKVMTTDDAWKLLLVTVLTTVLQWPEAGVNYDWAWKYDVTNGIIINEERLFSGEWWLCWAVFWWWCVTFWLTWLEILMEVAWYDGKLLPNWWAALLERAEQL